MTLGRRKLFNSCDYSRTLNVEHSYEQTIALIFGMPGKASRNFPHTMHDSWRLGKALVAIRDTLDFDAFLFSFETVLLRWRASIDAFGNDRETTFVVVCDLTGLLFGTVFLGWRTTFETFWIDREIVLVAAFAVALFLLLGLRVTFDNFLWGRETACIAVTALKLAC